MERSFVPSEKSMCLQLISYAASDAVGRVYVDYTFKNHTLTIRQQISDYFLLISNEFREMIKELKWMDEKSRQNALLKIDYVKSFLINPENIFDNDQLQHNYRWLNKIMSETTYIDKFDVMMANNINRRAEMLLRIAQETNVQVDSNMDVLMVMLGIAH